MKLKTLKDMALARYYIGNQVVYGVALDTLKQEAIKWLKRFKEKEDWLNHVEVITFIKHFFNITEEELK